MVIDAIAFKFQTGTQWVYLPEKDGNWKGRYNRLRCGPWTALGAGVGRVDGPADAATEHGRSTGRAPALIQQQRLPLLTRRPFPHGMAGLLLTEGWVYQLRRSLGIELARVRLHQWLTRSRLPESVRAWLRPMIYAVGCGMAVHLPALRRLSGFPEPMEGLGSRHRLSLFGADFAPSAALVLDEPYTDTTGLTTLHALAFTASARPDRHARAVAHLPGGLSRPARAALMLREWGAKPPGSSASRCWPPP